MRVEFSMWEMGDVSVDEIECDCGYKERPYDFGVEDGTIWRCPECGKRVRFKWVGMTFEVRARCRLSSTPCAFFGDGDCSFDGECRSKEWGMS